MEIPEEIKKKHCVHNSLNIAKLPFRICYRLPDTSCNCNGCEDFEPVDKVELLVDLGKHNGDTKRT